MTPSMLTIAVQGPGRIADTQSGFILTRLYLLQEHTQEGKDYVGLFLSFHSLTTHLREEEEEEGEHTAEFYL